MTRFIQSRILQAQTGSSSFFHAKNQKQRPGVQKLGRLAIDAVIAGYSLAKNVGTPNGVLWIQKALDPLVLVKFEFK